MHKVLYGHPDPLEDSCPDIDPALVAIVNRCLEKLPEQRYPDFGAVRKALDAVDRREPDHPQPAGPVDGPSADLSAGVSDTAFVSPAVLASLHADIPAPLPLIPESTPRDATVIIRPPGQRAQRASDFPEVQLVVTQGDPRFIGRSVRIDKPSFTIGRSDECDFCLAESSWSRHHAEVIYVNDGFVIRDRESSNGVYLNGRKIREAALPFGSTITIGKSQLTFSHVRDTSLPDLVGSEVGGRYQLQRLLRDSAKGAVYAAKDNRTAGDVAVKLLSPMLMRYPGYRDEFQRCAQIAVKLRHPHICGLIDYGVTTMPESAGGATETQFLCFELMAGGNLAMRLDAGDPISSARIEQWLTPIAGALDFAHRHDVLHGDLKPSAIVFDEEDHPYVTDFSIFQQSLHERGPVVGTPAYMAPELWSDGAVTPASDQFALAALIYYLVTGARPFEGQEHPDVRRRNFLRGPMPAHDEAAHNRRPDVPRAVSTVLAKALTTNPRDRFESAVSFAAAFKSALRRIVPRSEGPEVFISYQRDLSAPLAMYLADKLKAQGIRPFVDTQGLDRAGRFPPQIERAIEDADVFVCLLARTTLDSAYVVEEIRAAHRYEKPMIPIMQESYQPDPGHTDPAIAALLNFQGLPIMDKKNLHLEHTASDLVKLVKSAVAQHERND
jgi:serine/threonine-protein kinase